MHLASQKGDIKQRINKAMRVWPRRRLRRLTTAFQLSFLYVALMASAIGTAAEPSSTLQSSVFGDERLILAADPDSGILSGYLHDGACRVFFRGKLKPVIQYQRAGLGESYEVESWDPRRPSATVTTTLSSQATGVLTCQPPLSPCPADSTHPCLRAFGLAPSVF